MQELSSSSSSSFLLFLVVVVVVAVVEPLTLVVEGLSNFEACLVNEPSSSKEIYL